MPGSGVNYGNLGGCARADSIPKADWSLTALNRSFEDAAANDSSPEGFSMRAAA
jgi:hypothetical protein